MLGVETKMNCTLGEFMPNQTRPDPQESDYIDALTEILIKDGGNHIMYFTYKELNEQGTVYADGFRSDGKYVGIAHHPDGFCWTRFHKPTQKLYWNREFGFTDDLAEQIDQKGAKTIYMHGTIIQDGGERLE